MNFLGRYKALIAATLLAGGTYVYASDDPFGSRQSRIESAVAAELKDPSSAQFRNWQYGSSVACGEVNGKNSYGAYSGFVAFIYDGGTVYMRPGGGTINDVSMADLPPDSAEAMAFMKNLGDWSKLAQECYK